STAQVMPARVAYAAADAEVLPVEAHTTTFAPRPAAADIAVVMPRSLKEPVGFMPSTLTYTSAPVRCESAGASTSGVPPSPRVAIFSVTGAGRRSAYSVMTPRHWCAGILRLPRLAGRT